MPIFLTVISKSVHTGVILTFDKEIRLA